ncbi:MAG TPA: glycosyltransferase family 39 protein, partial [Candidatus Limnocylindria bacterium]|nr:glycosyltransferase family 39 protein [Candidatus Limnocylindria bacterium]
GERTLFWDEAYHVQLVLLPSTTEMLGAILANPPSDPLYALLLRAWAAFAGTTDQVIRLPSVLAGAATAPAAAWLGWELTLSRRVALASAILVAIAPYAVEFGQEASPYAFATLLTTLALAALWRWRRTGRRLDGALAVVVSIVAVYSHYVVPVVLTLVAFTSLSPLGGPRQVSARAMAVAAGNVLLAWLPWLVPMLMSWFSTDARTALAHTATPQELLGALSQYASGTGALIERIRPLQLLGIAAAGLLVARGWLVGGRPGLGGLRVVVLVAVALFVGPWLASVITGHWLFVAHLMLFTLPAVGVVLVSGWLAPSEGPATTGAAGRQPHYRRWLISRPASLAAAGLLVAQIGGLAVNAIDPPHGGDGSRDLAYVLRAEVATGEPVFIAPAELQPILMQYWDGPLYGLPADLDLRRLYSVEDQSVAFERSIDRFSEIASGASRVWLVYEPAREGDALFVAWLRQQAEVMPRASQPFGDLYEVLLPETFPSRN